MLRRLTGRTFHKVGAATLKDLSPNDFFIFPDGCFNKTPSWSECLLKIVSKISYLHSRSSFRLKMLQIHNNNCEIMKYQHKKSYMKPHANGCNIVSQKTHNTECELWKHKFLNEDIDVRDRSLFMWGGGGETWSGPCLFF